MPARSASYEAFISHHVEERLNTAAEALKAALEDLDISCFLDTKSLRTGESFYKKIIESIRDCRVVVVFFVDGGESSWVQFEAARGYGRSTLLERRQRRHCDLAECGEPLRDGCEMCRVQGTTLIPCKQTRVPQVRWRAGAPVPLVPVWYRKSDEKYRITIKSSCKTLKSRLGFVMSPSHGYIGKESL